MGIEKLTDKEEKQEKIKRSKYAKNASRQDEEEGEKFAWAIVNALRNDNAGEHHYAC